MDFSKFDLGQFEEEYKSGKMIENNIFYLSMCLFIYYFFFIFIHVFYLFIYLYIYLCIYSFI